MSEVALAGGRLGPAGLTTPGVRLSHVAAVALGNGLEFYDFLIFSTFALHIGRAYFPAHSPGTSLLLSLARFGIGGPGSLRGLPPLGASAWGPGP